MPLHCLRPKIESQIILIRNLNSPKLCNGTGMIFKQLSNNIIEAKFMTGKYKEHTVFISRIPLISTELLFQFRRLHFPFKLAYSFTISKAKGQTLKLLNSKNLYMYTPENKMKIDA